MVSAIVFDFDGVLVNTEPLHLAAYQEVMLASGLELTREDYYGHYLGYDDDGVFRRVASAHGWTLDQRRLQALVAEKTRVFAAILERTDVLYPDASACVERLAAKFPLGIASGALRHEIEMTLRRGGLDRCFRFIVAAGDTTEGKPSPDPYLHAARLHGFPPPACLAIEDSRWGIASAKAAGLKCVGVATTYPPAELRAADRVIRSLSAFGPDLIRGLDAGSPARVL